MDNIKIDPQLGLALSLTDEERRKSLDLNVGYDEVDSTWELIVQYVGDLTPISDALAIDVVQLFGDFAIIRIGERDIEQLLNYPEITYVEKPRMLDISSRETELIPQVYKRQVNVPYLGTGMEGITAICVPPVRREPYSLTGNGTLILVIDSGIDYTHPDFRNEDGSTRIVGIWDQTIEGTPPQGYYSGSYYNQEMINQALQAGTMSERNRLVPTFDRSGHGTHVAGIAAGNGRASRGRIVGVAPEANLLIVKLGRGNEDNNAKTTQLMQAVTFGVGIAEGLGRPLAINISYGNNYGAHDGSALLERYLDIIAMKPQVSVCIGMGNEGATGRHVSTRLQTDDAQRIEFIVAPFERGINLQLWKNVIDDMEIYLITPSGTSLGPIPTDMQGLPSGLYGTILRYEDSATEISVYIGVPTPYNQAQQIFISLAPKMNYITQGAWGIELRGKNIIEGRVDLWLPVAEATNTTTKFFSASIEGTLTIPSSASRGISVGAYNSVTGATVAFSGRGDSRSGASKPDVIAPGVDINAAAPGGGYNVRTGTSMATPFVTGATALMMEWGIVKGNDPYLYGEKIRAYLHNGARQLPGYMVTPNPQTGWGVLCVSESL